MKQRTKLGLALGLPLGLALAYLGICAFILDLSLTPKRAPRTGALARGGLPVEEITFTGASGMQLSGYFIPGGGTRAVVVVHGLDDNCDKDDVVWASELYHARGYDVLVYDQRGHGRSEGERLGLAFEESRDLAMVIGWLDQRGYAPGAIGLHGFSYGAATVLLAAPALPQVGAVVADSPFADMRELIEAELQRRTGVAGLFTPGVVLVARWFHGIDLDLIPPLRAVQRIAPRPVFLIHGARDEVIPSHHSERLKAAARAPRDILWIVPEAGHTGARELDPRRYAEEVLAFMDANLRGEPPAQIADDGATDDGATDDG